MRSSTLPRQRLDAGSFGTMGVGLGFLIAAKTCFPRKKVVLGAFGFSGMEVETITRYCLDITIIIINNNGIFAGVAYPHTTRTFQTYSTTSIIILAVFTQYGLLQAIGQ